MLLIHVMQANKIFLSFLDAVQRSVIHQTFVFFFQFRCCVKFADKMLLTPAAKVIQK